MDSKNKKALLVDPPRKGIDEKIAQKARDTQFDKIIYIANSIKYEEENKSYFMGLIKQIYSNIDGDEL